MGPLDRYAFRVTVSVALHLTLAVVTGVAAMLIDHPATIAHGLAGVAATQVLLALHLHIRLMRRLASSEG